MRLKILASFSSALSFRTKRGKTFGAKLELWRESLSCWGTSREISSKTNSSTIYFYWPKKKIYRQKFCLNNRVEIIQLIYIWVTDILVICIWVIHRQVIYRQVIYLQDIIWQVIYLQDIIWQVIYRQFIAHQRINTRVTGNKFCTNMSTVDSLPKDSVKIDSTTARPSSQRSTRRQLSKR